jgi:hypothetical protein
VLAPAEPLLVGGGDDLTVYDDCGCRVMDDGLDPENAHAETAVHTAVVSATTTTQRGAAWARQTLDELPVPTTKWSGCR